MVRVSQANSFSGLFVISFYCCLSLFAGFKLTVRSLPAGAFTCVTLGVHAQCSGLGRSCIPFWLSCSLLLHRGSHRY